MGVEKEWEIYFNLDVFLPFLSNTKAEWQVIELSSFSYFMAFWISNIMWITHMLKLNNKDRMQKELENSPLLQTALPSGWWTNVNYQQKQVQPDNQPPKIVDIVVRVCSIWFSFFLLGCYFIDLHQSLSPHVFLIHLRLSEISQDNHLDEMS